MNKLYFLFCLVFLAISYNAFTNAAMLTELNGWTLQRVTTKEVYPATVPGCVHLDLLNNKKIDDPFYRTNEKQLQWIDKEDWKYSTAFLVDEATLKMDYVGLLFKGLDTYANVYLNDSLILKADNMFREWKVNVKSLLKRTNTLVVYFHSPVKIGLEKLLSHGYPLPAPNDQSENGGLGGKRVSPFTRKAPYHYGWDWGPRFVTSGIWKPVYLEAWNNARIDNIQIVQKEVNKEKADITTNIDIESSGNQYVRVSIKDKDTQKEYSSVSVELSEGINRINLFFNIAKPQLWWTNGLGAPHLYNFVTTLSIDDKQLDVKETRNGLRSLKLVRNRDDKGETFYFELNGIPVFMKGANHIPNDIFLTRVTRDIYNREIQDAVNANMNMLRVWGGGIYESDDFYDLCDEHGILIWQDFMFACSMYPGDDQFLESVRKEAIDNVKRLRNHACIALWVGNNEIDVAWSQYNPNGGWGWKQQYNEQQKAEIWQSYEKIFHQLLPDVISDYDPTRSYWPSSPFAGERQHSNNFSTSGDMHYWGVWHAKEPFSQFGIIKARFMSEYGFQSFPDMHTIEKYTVPDDWNIESEVMSSHQRSGIGNLRIREYMSWYYKIPSDFKSFIYLAQVLQAEGIKAAIEDHRTDRPYCMGSLYWQINDCWPVASWSSIDYFGRWKALHYVVKKAYENVILVPSVKDNILQITAISDLLNDIPGKLSFEIRDFNGNAVWKQQPIAILLKGSNNQLASSIKMQDLPTSFDPQKSVLRAEITYANKSYSTLFYFKAVKDLLLPKPNIQKEIKAGDGGYKVVLISDKLAKNVYLSVDQENGQFSDNYFDLFPGQTVEVTYSASRRISDFEKKLIITSLTDTY